MPTDEKPQMRPTPGRDSMPLLESSKAKAESGERMLKIRPNPTLSAEGYYDAQMQRFPAMMAALGKY